MVLILKLLKIKLLYKPNLRTTYNEKGFMAHKASFIQPYCASNYGIVPTEPLHLIYILSLKWIYDYCLHKAALAVTPCPTHTHSLPILAVIKLEWKLHKNVPIS